MGRWRKEEEEGSMLQLVKQSSPNVKQRMRGLLPTGTEEREAEEDPDSPSE